MMYFSIIIEKQKTKIDSSELENEEKENSNIDIIN